MKLLPFDYAVRNLGRSPMRLALAFVGAILVAALATAASALLIGMERSLAEPAGTSNVLLMGVGSEESLERSEILPSVPSIVAASVADIPSLAGVPLVSAEAVMAVPVRVDGADPRGAGTGADARGAPAGAETPGEPDAARIALVRGVESTAFLVHSGVRIIEGRAPDTGGGESTSEAIVGTRAERQLGLAPGSLAVGASFRIDRTRFTVVGRFEAPGSVMEPEIWAPLTDVLAATKRTTISCVVVALDPSRGATFDDLDAFAARRLDLELTAITEREYLASLSRFFAPLRWMIIVAAVLVALGALLGGLNTLHAAFASRAREVGTLQAIGFSRAAVVISFAQESLILAAGGAIIAVYLCRWLLDGVGIAFSMGTFAFRVDASAVAIGLATGLGLAILGAAVPAIATMRRTIPEALRAP